VASRAASATTVALFLMGEHGHFPRMDALIRALTSIGADACVFTHRELEERVLAAGARFFDLLAEGRSVDALDTTMPRPSRNVTFAAVRPRSTRLGDELRRDERELEQTLVAGGGDRDR
jgi:UDP:flavonoid glycosyltransferase YjiC (YdhE family)